MKSYYVILCALMHLSNTLYSYEVPAFLEQIKQEFDLAPDYEITPEQVLDELIKMYKDAAQEDYIAEPVSQLEHALQAAQQAMNERTHDASIDDENVIAALLHDIGHRCKGKNLKDMDGFGIAQHDKIGAAFLRARGFSEKVARLIAGHVDAKRYHVFKDHDYHDSLTYASQQSLLRQGGPMTAQEAFMFEKDPYFKDIILLRRWEEQAKIPGAKTLDFQFYHKMILTHLRQQK